MKDIPLDRTLEILDSYSKTETFIMNHGKQKLDQVECFDDIFDDDNEDEFSSEFKSYPGSEVLPIHEKYWDSLGKDYDKELKKLFKTRVLEDGRIELTYKWWPLIHDLTREEFEASLLPEYMTFEEIKNREDENIYDYFAYTDAHDIVFYTRKAGRKFPESKRENEFFEFFEDFTEIWTTYKGEKYITSILRHED